jgi:hypothetical protein
MSVNCASKLGKKQKLYVYNQFIFYWYFTYLFSHKDNNNHINLTFWTFTCILTPVIMSLRVELKSSHLNIRCLITNGVSRIIYCILGNFLHDFFLMVRSGGDNAAQSINSNINLCSSQLFSGVYPIRWLSVALCHFISSFEFIRSIPIPVNPPPLHGSLPRKSLFHQCGSSKWGISRNIDRKM